MATRTCKCGQFEQFGDTPPDLCCPCSECDTVPGLNGKGLNPVDHVFDTQIDDRGESLTYCLICGKTKEALELVPVNGDDT